MKNTDLQDLESLNMYQTYEWLRKREATKIDKYKKLINDYMKSTNSDDILECFPETEDGFNKMLSVLSSFLFCPNKDEFLYQESAMNKELTIFIKAMQEILAEQKEKK